MRRYGLIGKHLSHSFSAEYFTRKFQLEGLSSQCEYRLYELSEIDQVRNLLSDSSICGLNVTIPYKQAIIPFLMELSSEAAEIGAVNCVEVLPGGVLIGHNTDIYGIRLSLDKLLGDFHPKSALILGSGGASKAVRYVVEHRGMRAITVSRTSRNGDITYDELTRQVIDDNLLIINASPVGMFPNCEECPAIPYNFLSHNHYLFDLVYNPAVTQFMKLGALRGAHTLSGIDMLYAQADKAWEIWNR